MAKLPAKLTKLKIEHLIEDQQILSRPHRHVGPSSLGHPCSRAVWYSFRNYTQVHHTPRLLRLFNRGHREEPIVIKDLEKADIDIIVTQEKAVFSDGHGNAYSDGRITNVPDAPKTQHLLEIKTSNTEKFKLFKRDGLEKTNTKYWVQIHIYMCLFKLKRCLYIIVNKETDERLYYRIKYRPEVAKKYLRRGEEIINSPRAPGRHKTYFCNWCEHKGVCNGTETPHKTCRSCRFIEPMSGGKWHCHKKARTIGFKKQQKACKGYAVIK